MSGSEIIMVSLDVNILRTDPGTQMRVKTDWDHVNELIEAIEAHGRSWPFPPIVAFQEGPGLPIWVADGFHRVAAARRAVLFECPAIIHPGTRRQAVLYAAGANADHGLKRTAADKYNAVRTLLNDPEWCEWADREIARQCNVSHPFVGKIRQEITGHAGQQDGRKYTNKHGETAVMAPKNGAGGVGGSMAPAPSSEMAIPAEETADYETELRDRIARVETAAHGPGATALIDRIDQEMAADYIQTLGGGTAVDPQQLGHGMKLRDVYISLGNLARQMAVVADSSDQDSTSFRFPIDNWVVDIRRADYDNPLDPDLAEAMAAVGLALQNTTGPQRRRAATILKLAATGEPAEVGEMITAVGRFLNTYNPK